MSLEAMAWWLRHAVTSLPSDSNYYDVLLGLTLGQLYEKKVFPKLATVSAAQGEAHRDRDPRPYDELHALGLFRSPRRLPGLPLQHLRQPAQAQNRPARPMEYAPNVGRNNLTQCQRQLLPEPMRAACAEPLKCNRSTWSTKRKVSRIPTSTASISGPAFSYRSAPSTATCAET